MLTWLAYRLLRLCGWQFRGRVPDVPKMIVIGAPHTTNWDFILYLGALRAYQIKARYMGKHTLFRWPFGYLFRVWGGIPVDRSHPQGVVRQVAEAFARADEMILVIAPEGTRKAASHWKAGFLNIAQEAGVPIVLASVDFPRRTVTLGPTLEYDGNPKAFMDQARRFYEDKRGLRPEGMGPVRVRDEG
jgi:1-acyl-sn-glycerol-3-phosphate acyltransferase